VTSEQAAFKMAHLVSYVAGYHNDWLNHNAEQISTAHAEKRLEHILNALNEIAELAGWTDE